MKIRNLAIGTVTGLAALINGCALDTKTALPIDEIAFFEKDVQNGINNKIEIRDNSLDNQILEVKLTPLFTGDPEHKASPFDYVEGSEIIITDNENAYSSGDRYSFDVKLKTKEGTIWRRFNISYWSGFSSPELERRFTEQIEEHELRIDELENRVDNIEEKVGIKDGGTPPAPATQPAPPQQNEQLKRLVNWSCQNLPRAVDDLNTPTINEGTDMRIFSVKPQKDSFEYDKGPNGAGIPQLQPDPRNPAAPGNSYHHLISSGLRPHYFVAVAGSYFSNVKEIFSPGINGLNPQECKHIYILNPELESINPGVFSLGIGEFVEKEGSKVFVPKYQEVIRAEP